MKHLIKFIQLFGFVNGLVLAFKFKFDKLDNFKIPGIKYPFALRKGTSDKATFFQVFVKKQYHARYPGPPLFIIDGGANIGLFAVYIKNRYPAATVVCVEPDTENFQALTKNIKAYDNIYCEHAGLWNKSTVLNVTDKYNAGKCGMVVDEVTDENEKGEQIGSLTIDDILQKYGATRIDILKLDIETSEKVLFSSNYESWLPKVKMIVIELHDGMEAGSSNNFFRAITASFTNFSVSSRGENTIIMNNTI